MLRSLFPLDHQLICNLFSYGKQSSPFRMRFPRDRLAFGQLKRQLSSTRVVDRGKFTHDLILTWNKPISRSIRCSTGI